MDWYLTTHLLMMVFQANTVFSTDVRVVGTALGKLWGFFRGFVLVWKEQAAEGLYEEEIPYKRRGDCA